HTLTAAAEGCLEDEGKAYRSRPGERLLGKLACVVESRAFPSRDHRHADVARRGPGGALVAHRLEGVGARPQKDQARVLAGGGEARLLGEESVAGMDGAGARAARDFYEGLGIGVGA